MDGHGVGIAVAGRRLPLGQADLFDDEWVVLEPPIASSLLGPNPLSLPDRVFKRMLDIFLSVLLIVLTLPLLVVAIIAVTIESPGPAIYRHQRLGIRGRRFWCYKLRTMTVAEDSESHKDFVAAMVHSTATPENGLFKQASNPRITPLGRLLRRLSIDELPQAWNVLKGDMSVVGPRPPILAEAAAYSGHHWERLSVRPGLTGLAQIRGRSALRFDLIVAADIEYTRTWSPLLELKILTRTPLMVLSGRGVA